MTQHNDEWYEWLLHRRSGGDAALAESVQDAVRAICDRVLDNACLAKGMTLVDFGSGEGVLGLRAIERCGSSLSVVFVDVSSALLLHARREAEQRGVLAQCRFVHLEDAPGNLFGDATVDIIAMRACLAYVPDKSAAITAFYEMLKPGGTISMGEPINQDRAMEGLALRELIHKQPDHPQIEILRLRQRMLASQFPCTPEEIARNPLTNYNERDLIHLARAAGFVGIHAELHVDLNPIQTKTWDLYLKVSQHPWAPTPGEVLQREFSALERVIYESAVRPNIESGQSLSTDMILYLRASKPGTR